MKRFLAAAIVLLTLSAFGPNETKWMNLSGQVVDHQTGQALIGATVKLAGTDQVVYTDPDGYFEMVAPVGEESELVIEYIAYRDQSISADSFHDLSIIQLEER